MHTVRGMGLIRKTLAVGTVGIVKPSSKKQRTAKQTRNAIRKQTAQDAALQVKAAAFQAELAGTLEARRSALEYELGQLLAKSPHRMTRSFRDQSRVKQLEAELVSLPPRPA